MFFDKVNKIDQPLVRLTGKQGRKARYYVRHDGRDKTIYLGCFCPLRKKNTTYDNSMVRIGKNVDEVQVFFLAKTNN